MQIVFMSLWPYNEMNVIFLSPSGKSLNASILFIDQSLLWWLKISHALKFSHFLIVCMILKRKYQHVKIHYRHLLVLTTFLYWWRNSIKSRKFNHRQDSEMHFFLFLCVGGLSVQLHRHYRLFFWDFSLSQFL